MEIDQAILHSKDRRLQTKYKNATYVIERAFALYEFDQVAFSFNGGKDSTVLLHLLRAGYYLHEEKAKKSNDNQNLCLSKRPIRTIYFETPSAFPEINSFTYETTTEYALQLEIIHLDFKSGLESLMMERPTKAIFLGTRIGDPNAVDVWAFLLTCKVQYCNLYDKGYTSIGSIHDTVPNALLGVPDSSSNEENFKPAYLLPDGRLERAGRAKKSISKAESSPVLSNGLHCANLHLNSSLCASIIAVGDEILHGTVKDTMGTMLCKKLSSIGWLVSHFVIVRNNIDSVAEEVEKRKSIDDMVFLFGGVGSLHSDNSVSGVAKAFGARLAPDEEFEEHLRHLIGDQCTGDRNEMALLPEGITELLHHEKLPVPMIKCENVIVLTSTNICELEVEWNCLIELPSTPIVKLTPYVSKHLSTKLSDVEMAESTTKLSFDYPDIHISCYRKSRVGPLIISFVGKDQARIDLAVNELCNKFDTEAFSEVSCV